LGGSSDPAFAARDIVASSPFSQTSHGAGVISAASNASSALAMLSKLAGAASPGKAALNHSTYCGIEFSVASTWSWVLAISPPACTGPLARAFRSAARPSRNCAGFRTALNTVGALRGVVCQLCPTKVSRVSSPLLARW
jgi:hypothetical protein